MAKAIFVLPNSTLKDSMDDILSYGQICPSDYKFIHPGSEENRKKMLLDDNRGVKDGDVIYALHYSINDEGHTECYTVALECSPGVSKILKDRIKRSSSRETIYDIVLKLEREIDESLKSMAG